MKKLIRMLFLLTLVCSLPSTAKARIDTAAPSKPYSPMLFGGFIEHFHRQIYGGLFEPGSPLSDESGFRKDVIAAMKELKLSVVRWPGGCFVSGYHWKDGVGKTRKSVADPVWGVTDPNIELAAAAWLDKREWNIPLLEGAGQDLDYMAVHQYWLRTEKKTPYKQCIGFSSGPEKMITSVIKIIEEAGLRGKIKIAYDEWNLRGWMHPGFPRKSVVKADDEKAAEHIAKRDINDINEQYTMGDALFTASFLNACLRHCEDVGMANIAPIVNTRGPLYVHPKGSVRRTTFHTLAMYANQLEERVVQLKLEAGGDSNRAKDLDAVATVDESGKTWAIALVNRNSSETLACTVKLGDRSLDGTFDATILAGDSPEAFNDVERPDRVAPEKTQLKFNQGVVNLPPHSLTIIRIR